MSHAALKLVESEQPDDGDSLRFERRLYRRRVIGGRVTSLQTSADPSTPSNRISSLQLLDISESGLGAIVQDSIELGSPIVVYFPPHGPEMGFDRYGFVVRCVENEHGYNIGIRLSTRSAA